MTRQPSSTKRGPGRRHKAGHSKATPIKPRGAPFGFVQHTNPTRARRRAAIKAAGGIRQAKKLRRAIQQGQVVGGAA